MDWQTLLTVIFGSSLVTLVIGWIKEVYFDRREEKKRRFKTQEEAYRELMRCVDFIYVTDVPNRAESMRKKKTFVENYRLLFLHAPDKVVLGINGFLDVMTSEQPEDDKSMKSKKEKIANSMLVLRKQFIRRTKLTGEDFRHIV